MKILRRKWLWKYVNTYIPFKAIAGWIYKSCYEEQIIIGQPDGTKSPLAEETKKMLAAISKIIIFGTANVGVSSPLLS